MRRFRSCTRPYVELLRVFSLMTAILVGGPRAAHAQDFHHPVPWVPEADVVCVPTPNPSASTLEADLSAVRTGAMPRPALELAASCAVTRHDIAAAFNEGGLARHRTGDFVASSSSFAQAVIADPSFLAARFNYACALARLGKREAAISEIGTIAMAGPLARRWLRRVATDPDLESIRDDDDTRSFVSGRSQLAFSAPFPTPAGLPLPAIAGPAFEPLTAVPWAPLRALLRSTPTLQGREGMQPVRPFAIRHPSFEGHVSIDGAAYFRPEPGQVFLVVPFTIPGPNEFDGLVLFHWNGAAFEPSCFEYCQTLAPVRHRDRRFLTDRPNEIRVVRCDLDGRNTCSEFLVQTDRHVARHRMGSQLSDVEFPVTDAAMPNAPAR